MNKTACVIPPLCVVMLLAAALAFVRPVARQQRVLGQEKAEELARPVPVEEDMHEFMEYVFEPLYKRLKAALAAEPANKQAWKGIKSDSLTLAEAANLLLIREADEEPQAWARHASSVRQLGAQLYDAAKKRNYQSARRSYTSVLDSCNRCHDQFADGEHQLSP